jgi:hypothetical protein
VVARSGVGGGVDQGVPAGAGGSGGGHHRHPGGPSPAVARAAGGVLRAGVVAVPRPELRLRAGHGQTGGRAVSPRRGQQLLEGGLDPDGWVAAGAGRRWRPPNISSLARARTRLGADPLHMLFELARFLPAGPGHVLVGSTDPDWSEHGCGCRELGHVMRPVDTRVRGHRGDLVRSGRTVALGAGECGLRVGADRVIGAGGVRRTRSLAVLELACGWMRMSAPADTVRR